MPTLVACALVSLVLLVAVGLQAPAASEGLRWEPSPQRSFRRYDPFTGFGIQLPTFADKAWPAWVGWLLIGLLTIGIVALVTMIVVLVSRIRPAYAITVAATGADSNRVGEPDAQVVETGVVAALAILAASERDSADAIVRAWQKLQDAAAAAGLDRNPAETAAEFTARLLYRSHESAEPIALLLSLYQRVRFGEHLPDAREIDAARGALAKLALLWKTDLPEQRRTSIPRS